MKVTVFGGSGFLGSHVADALTEAGHAVIIYDLRPSPYLQKTQQMVVGDIMDEKLVDETVQGCDVIYNFAGVADIDEASERPLDAIRSNILGNAILLDSCRRSGVKRFVFASSIYVYSNAGSFYRSSKQSCELLIENYKEAYGMPYTILRYGSLYGPRADGRNFIYHVIKQALTQGKIVRPGDGEEIREYIHVYDAAKSSVEILSKEFENQCVIIAGNQQMKVKDFLLMIKEILNHKISIEYTAPNFNYHYEITPYSFQPRLAKKIVSKAYVDLGQGILNYIHDIHKELNYSDGNVSREKIKGVADLDK